MNIAYIAPGQVAGFIPALLPFLNESQEWTRGRATVDDILRFVLNGQMQLWVVYEDNVIHGHIVTEVKTYPQCKMLAIQYCAMAPGNLEKIEDAMQELALNVASQSGCVGIEFVGRPGWKKTANKYGYSVQSVMYQKFLKEAQHGSVA
jgi:hypothetical protein